MMRLSGGGGQTKLLKCMRVTNRCQVLLCQRGMFQRSINDLTLPNHLTYSCKKYEYGMRRLNVWENLPVALCRHNIQEWRSPQCHWYLSLAGTFQIRFEERRRAYQMSDRCKDPDASSPRQRSDLSQPLRRRRMRCSRQRIGHLGSSSQRWGLQGLLTDRRKLKSTNGRNDRQEQTYFRDRERGTNRMREVRSLFLAFLLRLKLIFSQHVSNREHDSDAARRMCQGLSS